MRLFNLIFFLPLLITACSSEPSEPVAEAAVPERPNVLFIAVDDLRPEINTFGAGHIISPHLDSLAAAGLRFQRAYCNVPVCGASRSSILSGVRPTFNRFRHYYTEVGVEVPELTTLPEQFKNNGYRTVSIGKIFHAASDKATESWTDGPYTYGTDLLPFPEHSAGNWMNYVGQASKDTLAVAEGRALPWEIVDTTDLAYFDGQYAHRAANYLKEFGQSEEPFFLALGFVKPHLPFTAPKKYWDLYDRNDIRLPDNYNTLPADAPTDVANFRWGEMRNYHGVPKNGPVTDSMARTLLHGYYASVSFVDAQIGHVLNELQRQGLDENTLVVLWGDHGWNLGEHGFWCKHITMETSLRTTLLAAGPGVRKGQTDQIVELIDLYPTLLDYANLPLPEHELKGESLVPLLQSADQEKEDIAITRYGQGTTLVKERYNYTEFHDTEGQITDRMLFDHGVDPDENTNLANQPEYAELVEQLHEELQAQLPDNFFSIPPAEYPGRR